MKQFTLTMNQQLFRRAGIAGTICLLIISLSSCLKNDKTVIPPAALVSAINASPDATPLDFYLDGDRANNFGIKTATSMDYVRAYTGKRNISFTLNGYPQHIISDTATLKQNLFYSVFISNLISKPDILIITDSIAQPQAGKTTVRFVNLSPNAPAADLALQGGAVLASNKAYRTYSSFVTLDGGKAYTFEIRQAGTSTVLATLGPVTLPANTIYTIWLQGISGATDVTKLTAGIQQNVFYY